MIFTFLILWPALLDDIFTFFIVVPESFIPKGHPTFDFWDHMNSKGAWSEVIIRSEIAKTWG